MHSTPARTGSRTAGARSAQLLTLGLFVVMCAVFAFMSPIFLTSGNLLNIARQTAMLAERASEWPWFYRHRGEFTCRSPESLALQQEWRSRCS